MGTYTVAMDGQSVAVSLEPDGTVSVNGEKVDIDVQQTAPHVYSVVIGGHSVKVLVTKQGSAYSAVVNAREHDVIVESERSALVKKYVVRSHTSTQHLGIHAPMPALVVKVEVTVGETIQQGRGLVVLEAMKMENEIKAPQSGKVKEIYVTAGKPVEKGELLMLLEE